MRAKARLTSLVAAIGLAALAVPIGCDNGAGDDAGRAPENAGEEVKERPDGAADDPGRATDHDEPRANDSGSP